MILHLFKTDWQRLRIFIIGVWVIFLLVALPWLLHDVSSFSIPLAHSGPGGGDITELESSSHSRWLWAWSYFSVIGSSILLSTAIGMHDINWQQVSPIRRWQRFVAKFLAIFIFIVAPQVILGICMMLLHGFSVPLVLTSAAGIALSLILLHGTTAVFGRQCGTFWAWAPAMACLIAAAFVPSMFFRMLPLFLARVTWGLLHLHSFLDPWADHSSPQLWLYLGLALLGAWLLPRILRTRPGSIAAIASAIVGILLAGVCIQFYSPTSKNPALDAPSIQLAITAGDIRTQEIVTTDLSGRTSQRTSIEARFTTSGTTHGRHVQWTPYPVIGPTHLIEINRALPGISEVLPAPLIEDDSSDEKTMTIPATFIKTRDGVRTVSLTGVVFRYETMANLALSSTPSHSSRGDVRISTRLQYNRGMAPWVEAMVQYPLTDRSLNYPEGSIYGGLPYIFVLYLPQQKVCVKLRSRTYQYASIPGGGACSRLDLTWENSQFLDKASLASARLMVLKTSIDGTIKRIITLPPILDPPQERKGRTWTSGERISEAWYLTKLRPNRPDPATCTEFEFSRYLESIINQFPWDTVKLDIAEYAPRFPAALARYVSNEAVAYALTDVMPESAKADFETAITSPFEAFRAARTLSTRDWQNGTREQLLKCLDASFMESFGGQVYNVIAALAELEDPATYPALISAYESKGRSDYYQIIRSLPGIKPQLDEAVERVSRKLKTSLLEFVSFPSAVSDALKTYEAPVSHGNTTALSKLLEFWQNLPFGALGEIDETPPRSESADNQDKQPVYSVMAFASSSGSSANLVLKDFTRFFEVDPAIPHTLKAWRSLMAGKTAADFTYDSLSRKWGVSSINP